MLYHTNSSRQPTPATCAVIVTHNPSDTFSKLLSKLRSQVQAIIIVDNNTTLPNQALEKAKNQNYISKILNNKNLGLGRALNQGLERAIELGFDWVITFDQDSYPAPDMIAQLHHAHISADMPEKVALVAPQIIDINSGRRSRFLLRKFPYTYQQIKNDVNKFHEVVYAITSGAMVRTEIFTALRGFREDFFIDYIDIEYCLRLLQRGYTTLVASNANLYHTFGNRQTIRIGPLTLHPSFHSPQRWYTISRNRIQVMKTHGFYVPQWLIYDLIAASYTILRMLMVEKERKLKCSAMFSGTWDGWLGKLGRPQWIDKNIGNSS